MMDEVLGQELQKRNVKREVYDWIESVMIALICIVLVFTFVARIVNVDGLSMNTTLNHEDRLLSSRLFYKPSYGDIVVITMPHDQNEPLIKRIIATEGQEIDIDFNLGTISIDGVVLEEKYIAEDTYRKYDMTFPQIVPEGTVFAMGDNRNNSWDSRDTRIGMIDERYILGRIVMRVSPFSDIGDPDEWWENND